MIVLKQTVHTLLDNICWILPAHNFPHEGKSFVAIFTDLLKSIRLNDRANV